MSRTPYEISKEWCIESAKREGNAEIGAGSPNHPLRVGAPPMTATPSAEMEVKLEPCPFCGSPGISEWIHSSSGRSKVFYIGCGNDNCTCECSATGVDEAEAIAAWNRRPSSSIRREACEQDAMRIFAARKVHQLVVKHMTGKPDVALAALQDDGEIHRAVHDAIVGVCAQEWIDEQLIHSKSEIRREALEEAARKVREVAVDWHDDGQFEKVAASEYLESCIRALANDGKAPAPPEETT